MIIIVGTKTELFIFRILFINVAIKPGIKRIAREKKHIAKMFWISRFWVERVWKIKAGAKRNKTISVSVLGLIFFLEAYKKPIASRIITGKVMFKMYKKYSESKNWKFDVLNISTNYIGGVRESIVNISGRGVFSIMKWDIIKKIIF